MGRIYDEGWTLGDLAGELWARGIDIDNVPDDEIQRYLNEPRPELVAREIESDLYGTRKPEW